MRSTSSRVSPGSLRLAKMTQSPGRSSRSRSAVLRSPGPTYGPLTLSSAISVLGVVVGPYPSAQGLGWQAANPLQVPVVAGVRQNELVFRTSRTHVAAAAFLG